MFSLAVFLPTAASAQSSTVGRDASGQEATAEQTEKTRDEDWTFRWKDHPSLLLWDGAHVDFLFRMQSDLRASDEPLTDGSLNDVVRRRVGIAGDIGRYVRFEVEREVAGDDPWRDVYADYRQFDSVRLQAGKFKLPFSLDENTSATKLDFVYRSLAAESLAPGRDRGVMVHGRLLRRMFRYEFGIFEHDGRNARTNNPHRIRGDRTMAGRITVQPLRALKSKVGDLQIGAAIATSDLDEGLSSLRGRSVLGQRFYTADALVNGRRQRVGFELAWDLHPIALKAEHIRLTDTRLGQSVENTDLPPLLAKGWYVSGTWAVVRRRPRLGSLELAARIEGLTFNQVSLQSIASPSPRADIVPGSRDTALTVGMNWSPIRWLRIQTNVIREVIDDSNRASWVRLWSRVVRFQLAI